MFTAVQLAAASANTAGTAATQQDTMGSIIYMLCSFGVLILVFYFFMIRPQKKKEKEAKEMKEALQIGDEIVTIGGITGIVVRINRNSQNSEDDSIVIETGGDRNKVRVMMWAISKNLTMHDAVEEAPKAAAKPKKEKPAKEKAEKSENKD